ncbi:MAG: hypothetical protein ACOYT8_01355 [Candidatus Dependentiae bacterium]
MKKYILIFASFVSFHSYGLYKEIKVVEKINVLKSKCGICRQENIEVPWLGSNTYGAHEQCFDLIQPCVENIFDNIQQHYSQSYQRAQLEQQINSAIEDVCEKAGYPSIKAFIEVNGQDKLKQLYKGAAEAILAKQNKPKNNSIEAIYNQIFKDI